MTTETTGYFDLGDYSRPTSTNSPEAQRWFDRGLIWAYAFNHEEARHCFERAVVADPRFAMAHWGIAYAIGPNYNKTWEMFEQEERRASLQIASDAMHQAKELCSDAPPVERALVDALALRFQAPDPDGELERWAEQYAEALRRVQRAYPDDLDVAALLADALMSLTAWQLWEIETGRPAAGARTEEARTVLEAALAQPDGDRHPGVLHFYLHLMEMSPRPQDALPAADALRGLVPDGGHLQHMPTHIDVLCGDYVRVIADNTLASAADDRYMALAGRARFYSLYVAHNHHFRIYGAMFAGRRAQALKAVAALEQAIPEDLLRVRTPPMADWLEGFVAMRLHVMVRFGMWDEIIAAELPADPELYCTTTAMAHYAKGLACAATGRIAEAEAARERFAQARARVPESRTLFNNTCVDILGVAALMLEGELAYRKADFVTGFARLRDAIAASDSLPYDEPWGWMQPVRHAYGALLLEQGHVQEACDVYAADLGVSGGLPRSHQHPANVWSLHGYRECLERLGEATAAQIVAQQLEVALARADIAIGASCFCRVGSPCC